MSSIPLPALAIRPPEPNDALGAYTKLVSLGSLLQQQRSQQQEMELRQQQIQDQQATTAAMKNWDGKDYDALSKSVLQNGGSANAATAIQQHGLTIKKTVSDIAKQDAETGSKNLDTFIGRHKAIGDALQGIEAVPDDQLHDKAIATVNQLAQAGVMDQNTAQMALSGIQQVSDPKQLRESIDTFAKASMGAKAVAEQAKIEAEGQKASAEAEQKRQESEFYKKFGFGAPGVPAETAAMLQFLRDHPGKTPLDFYAHKSAAEAAATQPFKIQTAQAEAQARMALEGMAKPGYGLDPRTGQKDLMSQTEAIAQHRIFTPVTGKEVSEDTMLINRLSDVHQKIAEYERALQKPISAKDQSNLAALLGVDKTKVSMHPSGIIGGLGFEIPMDRLDAALNKENLSGLSANARDQLVAYRNAREALTGYTRVLTGSGRSSDKNLELQEQTLPVPSYTDPDFSRRALDAFKQNLRVVGQGLPNIPGVKTPEQWEQELSTPTQKQPSRAPMSGISSLLSQLQGQ